MSGGLDSYTAAAIAHREGFTLYALTVRYGQRHAHEIEAARAVAKALDVERHIELGVDLSAFGGSALTSDIPVPKGRSIEEARAVIRAFKGLMSVHEARLDGEGSDGNGAAALAGGTEPEVSLGDLAALQGVVKFPVRIKCATLSWNTLQQGLDEAS